MEKFALDYNSLVTKIDRPKEYKLAEVKDRIERVAFDVVRFRDNEDVEQLWRVDEREDGPVIVALYEDKPTDMTAESSEKKWEALPDKKAGCLHLYYKGDPIVRLAADDVGIPDAEIEVMARWLPYRLEQDGQLRQLVLDKSGDKNLTKKYPELKVSAADLKAAKLADQIKTAGEEALGKDERVAKGSDDPLNPQPEPPSARESAPADDLDEEKDQYVQKIKTTLDTHLNTIQSITGLPTEMFEVSVNEHLKDPFVEKTGEPVEMALQEGESVEEQEVPEPLRLAASLIVRAGEGVEEDLVREMRIALLKDIETTNAKIEPKGLMVDPEFTDRIEKLSVKDVVA